MGRGSKPGERRGGRQRGTPNRRRILTDRILTLAAAHPQATVRQLQRFLVADRDLPADTRLALARKPVRTRAAKAAAAARRAERPAPLGQRLEALWIIARDLTASAPARRAAAHHAAELLLPKVPSRSRWPQTRPDAFGFAAHPDIAREYRDAFVSLCTSVLTSVQHKKLEARRATIRARHPCPCPSRYQVDQICNDARRLSEFVGKRNEGIALTAQEDAEEAHRRLRIDSYFFGPEWAAIAHLAALKEKQRKKKEQENTQGKKRKQQRLSLRELTVLRFLQLLYPPIPRAKQWKAWEWDMEERHPFNDDPTYPNGLYYPPPWERRDLHVTWVYPKATKPDTSSPPQATPGPEPPPHVTEGAEPPRAAQGPESPPSATQESEHPPHVTVAPELSPHTSQGSEPLPHVTEGPELSPQTTQGPEPPAPAAQESDTLSLAVARSKDSGAPD